ncbi:hypothetical protein TNCT6_02770 [Streptomyces sp. 6-11-2]|nr:hypothetical protein TNCT6_02770 [Streptomyces sp. 6-11-2]
MLDVLPGQDVPTGPLLQGPKFGGRQTRPDIEGFAVPSGGHELGATAFRQPLGGARADGWTARDIDTALYWTGANPHPPVTADPDHAASH